MQLRLLLNMQLKRLASSLLFPILLHPLVRCSRPRSRLRLTLLLLSLLKSLSLRLLCLPTLCSLRRPLVMQWLLVLPPLRNNQLLQLFPRRLLLSCLKIRLWPLHQLTQQLNLLTLRILLPPLPSFLPMLPRLLSRPLLLLLKSRLNFLLFPLLFLRLPRYPNCLPPFLSDPLLVATAATTTAVTLVIDVAVMMIAMEMTVATTTSVPPVLGERPMVTISTRLMS